MYRLDGLILRRSGGSLSKRPHDRLARERYLEVVLALAFRSDENPIGELQKLWDAYQPQLQDYIDRALDPAKAPGYGVAGDDR